MRKFEVATKKVLENGEERIVPQFENTRLPEYATKHSAGADFFCAESITIEPFEVCRKPTLVHTGVKACMEENEVLCLYNRSSNPLKLGLVLANSVGIIDADYYGNKSNDGEIMFAFINISDTPVTLNVGDKLGQGVFTTFLRPTNADIKDDEREGGFGHTDNK